MNLQNLSAVVVCVVLTACAPVKDGALGRFHRYDANEYTLTVGILHAARSIESQCGATGGAKHMFENLKDRVGFFLTYAEGRPHNNRTVGLATDLRDMIADTANRNEMSEFFCQERAKNIVRASEILRSASGEKPE